MGLDSEPEPEDAEAAPGTERRVSEACEGGEGTVWNIRNTAGENRAEGVVPGMDRATDCAMDRATDCADSTAAISPLRFAGNEPMSDSATLAANCLEGFEAGMNSR